MATRKTIQGIRSGERGFTLVEVTIILLVLVILSMIMLPQLGNFNRLARKVKVYEDLGAICATLKKMLDEVQVSAFWGDPGGGTQAPSGIRVGLLRGPGSPPSDANDAAFHQVSSPDAPWSVTTIGAATHTIATDAPGNIPGTSLAFGTDRFENHLQINDPFGDGSVATTSRYINTSENVDADFFLSWKGPYFDSFTPDPWGQWYASNVFALHTYTDAGAYEYYTSAVVCYSAGPDGQVSTRFNQPMDSALNSYGWETGGDDIAVILSSGGPF